MSDAKQNHEAMLQLTETWPRDRVIAIGSRRLSKKGSIHPHYYAAVTAGEFWGWLPELWAYEMARAETLYWIFQPMKPHLRREPNMQFAIDARKTDAEEILNLAVKEVGDLPCEIRTEIIEGDAAEAVIDVAITRKSDVIVMGSRGLGRLAGLLLGSTSQKVVAHAPCPVLIVR